MAFGALIVGALSCADPTVTVPAPDSNRDLVWAGFKRIYDPSVGEDGPWYINDHNFVYGPDKRWHLFGITNREGSQEQERFFAHATSPELTAAPWKKMPQAMEAAGEPWNELHLWAPHIVRHDGLYYMFYTPGSTDRTRYPMFLATSKDLESWERHDANPLFVDGFDARDPFVMRLGNRWIMYYTATSEPEGGNHIVAYRFSDDLIEWGERGVAYVDARTGTHGGPTESPFVVRRGPYFYLFIGPRSGYTGVVVLRSESPLSWTLEDRVGYIEAHASEVVRDLDGKWYVSHCGWAQRGVWLSPLYWNDGLDDEDTSLPVPGR